MNASREGTLNAQLNQDEDASDLEAGDDSDGPESRLTRIRATDLNDIGMSEGESEGDEDDVLVEQRYRVQQRNQLSLHLLQCPKLVLVLQLPHLHQLHLNQSIQQLLKMHLWEERQLEEQEEQEGEE